MKRLKALVKLKTYNDTTGEDADGLPKYPHSDSRRHKQRQTDRQTAFMYIMIVLTMFFFVVSSLRDCLSVSLC